MASASATGKSESGTGAGSGGNKPVEAGSGSVVLSGALKVKRAGTAEVYDPDYDWSEEGARHFYPRVLNATLHPIVRTMLGSRSDILLLR